MTSLNLRAPQCSPRVGERGALAAVGGFDSGEGVGICKGIRQIDPLAVLGGRICNRNFDINMIYD